METFTIEAFNKTVQAIAKWDEGIDKQQALLLLEKLGWHEMNPFVNIPLLYAYHYPVRYLERGDYSDIIVIINVLYRVDMILQVMVNGN